MTSGYTQAAGPGDPAFETVFGSGPEQADIPVLISNIYFSQLERNVAKLMREGVYQKDIAERLNEKIPLIRETKIAIFRKLNVENGTTTQQAMALDKVPAPEA